MCHVPWSGSAIIHCSSIHSFLHLETHIFQIWNISLNYWVGQKVHSGSTITSYTKTWINFLSNPTFLWWLYLYYFLSLLFLKLLFKYYFSSTGPLISNLFTPAYSSSSFFFFFFWLSSLWEVLNFIFQPIWKVSIFCYHCFNFWMILFSEYFFSKYHVIISGLQCILFL